MDYTPTTSAIDISKLPPPDVVEPLDYATIREQYITDLLARDVDFDALVESDPAIKILEVAAYREMMLRQRVNDGARSVMLAYAMGNDLENLGALFGVPRWVLDPGDPQHGIAPTLEDIEDYRRRIVLGVQGYSVAGPEGAYIIHTLNADKRVLDASAYSPAPGVVVVTVLSREGDGTAPPDLLNVVAAAVNGQYVRPMTDQVLVQSAQIVRYAIEGTVYTYGGPDSDLVMDESRRRARKYADKTCRLGRSVALSGVYAAAHGDGVQDVELQQPAANMPIDRTQAAYCTDIVLQWGGVSE
ncbi:baseplate assembly protein [Dyella sp. M7H15-1]|uniref:baseplate assembly protein n=1 Tax=Dyella sp. M7H15-1 TaxID=2501295 RepID=UPI0010050227|nr:baseplate J/gp47 family protein [Dyella sp. M7H15-1]QAU22889.1 baseplate assembly protein [Dyella sp. M7H15-1]